MPFGTSHDAQVVEALALGPLDTTRIAKELKVDDGELRLRLHELEREGVVRICGANGQTPVWELTDRP